MSGESVGSTRIETLPRISFSSRSLILREVTYLPSWPEKGESLMPKVMVMVGSSIWIGGSGAGSSIAERVSPMLTSVRPTTATMSPGPAESIGTRFRPS